MVNSRVSWWTVVSRGHNEQSSSSSCSLSSSSARLPDGRQAVVVVLQVEVALRRLVGEEGFFVRVVVRELAELGVEGRLIRNGRRRERQLWPGQAGETHWATCNALMFVVVLAHTWSQKLTLDAR